jgi:hypothetical protein
VRRRPAHPLVGIGGVHLDQPSGQIGIKICESAHRQATEGVTGEHVGRLNPGLPKRVAQLDSDRLGIPRPAAASAPAKPRTVVGNASDSWSKLLLDPVPVR